MMGLFDFMKKKTTAVPADKLAPATETTKEQKNIAHQATSAKVVA